MTRCSRAFAGRSRKNSRRISQFLGYEQTLPPIFPSLKQAKAEYVKIGAGFQQVSGEAVAEHVGINLFLDAGTAGGMLAGVARSLGIDGLIAAVPAVAGKQPDTGSFPQPPPPSGTP